MSYFSHENLHTNEVNLFILLQEKTKEKREKSRKRKDDLDMYPTHLWKRRKKS